MGGDDTKKDAALKINTIQTLRLLLADLKVEALHSGHYYHEPRTAAAFDNRDKSKAFRSVGYNQTVLRINALQDAIDCLSVAHAANTTRRNDMVKDLLSKSV